MSRFAKAVHLTCGIVASLTCVVWSVIFGLLVFYWRTISPRPDPVRFVFFLIPAIVVGAGAVMEFSFYNDERKGDAAREHGSILTNGRDTASSGFVLITTKLRALAAIAFTLWVLIQGLRSLSSMQPYSLIWPDSGLFPRWSFVLTTVVLYSALLWMAMNIALAPSRKEEKALMFTLFAVPLLAPVGILLPKATSSLRFLQMLLELTALLASISILLSLHKSRREAV